MILGVPPNPECGSRWAVLLNLHPILPWEVYDASLDNKWFSWTEKPGHT